MTEINFKSKEFIYNHHLAVPHRPLTPDLKKSVGEIALDGNLIIQGDNLHALKSLLPLYAGKVDCVFIDPPYNTGNEGWIYNDRVNAPQIKEWLEDNPITIEDQLRHDKWCAMIWPRLRLLHELLADHGIIFICIDDNEIHRLRALVDEIFGEINFVGQITVRSNPGGRDYGGIARVHDYLLVYAKEKCQANLANIENEEIKFSYSDSKGDFDLRELRNRNIAFNSQNRPNLYYPFYIKPRDPDENGLHQVSLKKVAGWKELLPKKSQGIDTVWRWSKKRVQQYINLEIMAKPMRDGGFQIVEKYRETSRRARSIWTDTSMITEAGSLLVKNILGKKDAFTFPKPIDLITRCLQMASKRDSIVLDSFAGSGTTAHAVLEMNKRDGGNRKFILVEMENDISNTVTAERVRRAIKGYKFTGTQTRELLRTKLNWTMFNKADELIAKIDGLEKMENGGGGGVEFKIKKTFKDSDLIVTSETKIKTKQEGLGGTFTYCTLGEEIDLNRILTGEALPDYDAFANVMFYIVTNQSLKISKVKQHKFYLGETETAHVWMIYKPDLDWLKSPSAALTLSRAREFFQKDIQKEHYIIAAANFVGHDILRQENLTQVRFIPLPYALYRMTQS